MNHPRRLLLVPLALLGVTLLGTAWLVRARLPRPQTEGDKWLWEQTEQVFQLRVVEIPVASNLTLNHSLPDMSRYETLYINDRNAIRTLLRTLHTDSFTPVKVWSDNTEDGVFALVSLDHKDFDGTKSLVFLQRTKGFLLLNESDHTVATPSSSSVKRFFQLLHTVVVKARHNQHGYWIKDCPYC